MPGASTLVSPALDWLDWSLAESPGPSSILLPTAPVEPALLIVRRNCFKTAVQRALCLGVGEDEAVLVVTMIE